MSLYNVEYTLAIIHRVYDHDSLISPFNSYRAGWFLKCSFLLKSEVYPVFLLLYLSSTALKLISVNRKVVRNLIFYPLITKWLSFALTFLILISFSSALFLQLEMIRNTIHLYGQMHIFIKNVRINVKFIPKYSMWTYQYLLSFRKPKTSLSFKGTINNFDKHFQSFHKQISLLQSEMTDHNAARTT